MVKCDNYLCNKEVCVKVDLLDLCFEHYVEYKDIKDMNELWE